MSADCPIHPEYCRRISNGKMKVPQSEDDTHTQPWPYLKLERDVSSDGSVPTRLFPDSSIAL